MPYTVMFKPKDKEDGWAFALSQTEDVGLIANKESAEEFKDYAEGQADSTQYDFEVVKFRIDGGKTILEWERRVKTMETDDTGVPVKPSSGAVFVSAAVAKELHEQGIVTVLEVADDDVSCEIAADNYVFRTEFRYAVEGAIHFIVEDD